MVGRLYMVCSRTYRVAVFGGVATPAEHELVHGPLDGDILWRHLSARVEADHVVSVRVAARRSKAAHGALHIFSETII